MKLNSNNYFSTEAAEEYFSVSQYKDFAGSIGRRGCEAIAMAKSDGIANDGPYNGNNAETDKTHFDGVDDVAR